MNESMVRDIQTFIEVPEDIQAQAVLAVRDLYFGPHDETVEYLGFEAACDLISAWCEDNLSPLWYDQMSGEMLDSEPSGYSEEDEDGNEIWVDPDYECVFEVSVRDIKKALFGAALASYI